jgi:hypothetical protein
VIASSDTAAAPAQLHSPAGRDSILDARRMHALRIALRPSWMLQALLLGGLLVAVAAFYTTLSPWLDGWRSLTPALALGAAGLLGFAAWRRAQPAFIEIGTDRFAAFSRTDACLVDGRLLGAAQWGGALLALVIEAGGGYKTRKTLLVAADSLDAESFRILAVSARGAFGPSGASGPSGH